MEVNGENLQTRLGKFFSGIRRVRVGRGKFDRKCPFRKADTSGRGSASQAANSCPIRAPRGNRGRINYGYAPRRRRTDTFRLRESVLMCAPIGRDKVVPVCIYTPTHTRGFSQAGNKNCHTAPLFFFFFFFRSCRPSIRRFLACALRPVGKRTHGFSHTFVIASDWPNNSGYAADRSFSVFLSLPRSICLSLGLTLTLYQSPFFSSSFFLLFSIFPSADCRCNRSTVANSVSLRAAI